MRMYVFWILRTAAVAASTTTTDNVSYIYMPCKYQLILNVGYKISSNSFAKIQLTRLKICKLLMKRFKIVARTTILHYNG